MILRRSADIRTRVPSEMCQMANESPNSPVYGIRRENGDIAGGITT
jgi:hypothetical protein